MNCDDKELKVIRVIWALLIILWFLFCSALIAHCDYSSQSAAINGMCAKFDYYFKWRIARQDGYYSRYDYYAICFDRYDNPELNGNTISGSLTYVSFPYDGDFSVTEIYEMEIPTNANDLYSNFPDSFLPADNSISVDFTKQNVYEEQKILFGLALLIGYAVTVRIFTGHGLC